MRNRTLPHIGARYRVLPGETAGITVREWIVYMIQDNFRGTFKRKKKEGGGSLYTFSVIPWPNHV